MGKTDSGAIDTTNEGIRNGILQQFFRLVETGDTLTWQGATANQVCYAESTAYEQLSEIGKTLVEPFDISFGDKSVVEHMKIVRQTEYDIYFESSRVEQFQLSFDILNRSEKEDTRILYHTYLNAPF